MAPNASIIPVKRRIVPGRYRDVAPAERKPIRREFSLPGFHPRLPIFRPYGAGDWDNGGIMGGEEEAKRILSPPWQNFRALYCYPKYCDMVFLNQEKTRLPG